MTRLFTEGFEFGVFNGFIATAGSPVRVSSTARSGSYCFNVPGMTIYREFSGVSEVYFRYGYNTSQINSTNQRFQWLNGTTVLGHLRLEGEHITAYTSGSTLIGTGSVFIPSSTWFLLEAYIKIDNSIGRIVVKIDGITDIDFTGDTQPDAITTINRIGNSFPGASTHYVDDIAINNALGETDSGWCGDGHIILLKPVSDGDVLQLIPSSGSSHWSLVDDIPPNITDYVSGSTVGEYDLYHISDFGLTGQTISRIWTESTSLDTVAEGGYISLGIKRVSGSISWSGSLVQLTSYSQSKGTEYLLNPDDGQPWEASDLNSLQIAIKTEQIS